MKGLQCSLLDPTNGGELALACNRTTSPNSSLDYCRNSFCIKKK
jgi:hypothetical protein